MDLSRGRIYTRRILFFSLVGITILFVAWRAWLLIRANGVTPLEWPIFALFVTLFAPIALSFWTAILGFTIRLRGGDELDLSRDIARLPANVQLPLTAIAMPIYNEDPARVFAGLKATYDSVERTGRLESFEFFILSDSTDPDVWIREELAFTELRKQVSRPDKIFYRNRTKNTEKKTGNIADFCRNWGDRYEYMIVFDADSVMSGTSLVNLVRLMDEHPNAGIIQAPPLPVNRKSLFGRLHQFAMHFYSSLFISGLNFWQGGAANYWGHNAIIRIRPFMEHCKLPTLPGKPPLGGQILSHDFVEAAFMRRAGWRVYLASELRGSYEEMPSSLIGYAARDRRWCQGNLQHGKLLFSPGLHFISRVHILMGIMGYAASPLWLLLLALTTIEAVRQSLTPHQYFQANIALFPAWQVSVENEALLLFLGIMTILLLPKFLSLVLHLRPVAARRFGGVGKMISSVVLEVLISTLLAPALAWLHARFVAGILLGQTTGWDAQDRGDAGTPWKEAWKAHWPATVAGVGWTLVLALAAPKLLPWFSPVILGLLLAVPLSVWTSKATAGVGAASKGLFLIPEETRPPRLLRELNAELDRIDQESWAKPADGITQIVTNPELRAIHLAGLEDQGSQVNNLGDPLTRNRLEGLVLAYLHKGASSLERQQRRELLLTPSCIALLLEHKRIRNDLLPESPGDAGSPAAKARVHA